MAITFPAGAAGAEYTNPTTGVKYYWDTTDEVWKTHVWPTNTNYLQLSGGTLTGNLSLGTNDLTAQDVTASGAISANSLSTTAGLTVGNGLTVSDGNVVMAAGHGIDFSATGDSSAAMQNELFDDYEEGTWTPGYDTSTTSSSAIGYSNQTGGSYIKVGRAVYICGRIRTANAQSLDGTGNIVMTGLPFAISSGFDGSSDTQDCSAIFSLQQIDGWNDPPLVLLGQEGFSRLDLYKGGTLAAPVALGDFATASSGSFNRMRFSGFYFTDS